MQSPNLGYKSRSNPGTLSQQWVNQAKRNIAGKGHFVLIVNDKFSHSWEGCPEVMETSTFWTAQCDLVCVGCSHLAPHFCFHISIQLLRHQPHDCFAQLKGFVKHNLFILFGKIILLYSIIPSFIFRLIYHCSS